MSKRDRRLTSARSDDLRRGLKRNHLWGLQQVNDALALLLEGKPEREIRAYLADKYRIGPQRVGDILARAREACADRVKLEARHLITLHLHRYEDLYAQLMDLKALAAALEVLKFKEQLLGFHKANFALRVTHGGHVQQVHQRHERPEYDVTRLANEERAELEVLLEKARKKKELKPTTE